MLCHDPNPLAFRPASTPSLEIVRDAARAKHIWRADYHAEFLRGMIHAFVLSIMSLQWERETACGLIANAEFCF